MKVWPAIYLAAAASVGPALSARAQGMTVGTVSVCYYSGECTYANVAGMKAQPTAAQRFRDTGEHPLPVHSAKAASETPVDAPAFLFTNTGRSAITNAKFEIKANKALGIVADSFDIGKIKPGASVAVVPGASNDKKTHPAGGFFTYDAPGNPLDTSDSGPDDNAVVFMFKGKVDKQTVSSGSIVTGATAGPSVDGTVASLNFLGGPGNADAPCGDCFGSLVIATISSAGGGAK